MKRHLSVPILLAILLSAAVTNQTAHATGDTLTIEKWLYAGPTSFQNPVFHDQPALDGQVWAPRRFLEADTSPYSEWEPYDGMSVSLFYPDKLSWRVTDTTDGWLFAHGPEDTTSHRVMWAAAYITADRWLEADLTLESPSMLRVFLNGEPIVSKTTFSQDSETAAGRVSHTAALHRGTHLLLVKLVQPSGHAMQKDLLRVQVQAGEFTSALRTGTDPRRAILQRTISNAPRPAGVSISPDGTLAAVHVRQAHPPDGTSEAWIDILNISDGSLYRRLAGTMTVSGMQWLPEGRRFSYTHRGTDGTDLWVVDLDTGEKTRVLHGVDDFSGYRWGPDASWFLYGVRQRHDPRRDGVLRYHGLQDRRPGYHSRTFLHQHFVEGNISRQVTAGRLTTSISDIHPDGKLVLLIRSHEEYRERPYGKSEYLLLNLATMQVDSLFTASFAGSGRFSPDGNQILFMGGPSMFGRAGTAIADTLIPNDYDTQAYLYHWKSGEVEPLTREFDPAIQQAYWSSDGRYVYMVVTEQSYRKIYRYDTRRREFRHIEAEPDVVGSFQLARDRDVAVFTGSGASQTPKTWTIDLTRRNPRSALLLDPGEDAYRNIRFGEVKTWIFLNDHGENIDGHVYYPPDFDAGKRYPVIVYYYGGTTPVTRSFGGRYPKEVYASKGYLVYVLQPSGAIGYGQEFSARHVNDWGPVAGGEIIQGVELFLAAHPYADPDRVGAIGASYGGFMTMYLLTQTDLFAAGVSHAGISNLASYWGEGFWGYQYSGVATAGSYPWNRHDIYVERSPLFQADRITTPLLLLTGMSDTNVPPGESLQMFTALKLLGRDAAFIAVEDQDHHILDYKKFLHWKDAILSWFDKWLKNEPEWWEKQFGN